MPQIILTFNNKAYNVVETGEHHLYTQVLTVKLSNRYDLKKDTFRYFCDNGHAIAKFKDDHTIVFERAHDAPHIMVSFQMLKLVA